MPPYPRITPSSQISTNATPKTYPSPSTWRNHSAPALQSGRTFSSLPSSDTSSNLTPLSSASVSNLDLSLDCINCGTSGHFDISGRIIINLWGAEIKELSIQARPRDFQARLELEITADGTVKDFSDSKQLLSVPIPGAGIAIGKIFKLGASLDYDIGLSASVQGHAAISYGLIGTISNDAVVKVDAMNTGNNRFSGWAPSFETIPFKADAEVTGSLAVYGKPSLSLGFNVLIKWGYEAELSMKLPEIATTLKAKADTNGGLCGVKANKAALEAAASVGVDLGFRVGEDNGGKTLYEKSLYEKKYSIFNKCVGLSGSGTGSGTDTGLVPPKRKSKTTAAPKKAPPKPTQSPKKAAPIKKPAARKLEELLNKLKPTHSTKKPIKTPVVSSKAPVQSPKPEANKKDNSTKTISSNSDGDDEKKTTDKAPASKSNIPSTALPKPASASATPTTFTTGSKSSNSTLSSYKPASTSSSTTPSLEPCDTTTLVKSATTSTSAVTRLY